jgi:hypothetical protein
MAGQTTRGMSRLALFGLIPTMVLLPLLLFLRWPLLAVPVSIILWLELGAQVLYHLENLDRLHSPRLRALNERLHRKPRRSRRGH